MSEISRPVSRLAGYAPSLPTPFDGNDAIDGEALAQLCGYQIRDGATALVVCGATGEAPTLTYDEHELVIRIAVETARGRVRVIAAVVANSTDQAIALARQAELAGADALLCSVPYYNKPTQIGMHAHFTAIAQATALPLILDDTPARCVCGLADETIARLADTGRFIGLMDSTGDLTRPARLKRLVAPDFRLMSGDDRTAPAFLALGGHGCISVTSNVAPGLCRSLYLAGKQGQVDRFERLANVAARLTGALLSESDPAPVKFALSQMGLMPARVRLPLVEPSAEAQRAIGMVVSHVHEGYADYLIGTPADGGRKPQPAGMRRFALVRA